MAYRDRPPITPAVFRPSGVFYSRILEPFRIAVRQVRGRMHEARLRRRRAADFNPFGWTTDLRAIVKAKARR